MELAVWPATKNIVGRGVELRVQSAEVVVDRRGAEHADALTLALHQLEPLRLYDDAEALDEKDAAEDGQ